MSMSLRDVTTAVPSFVPLATTTREEAVIKIEAGKKKALATAQELTGEDRTVLEGRITALAEDMKKNLDEFISSKIFDSEQMCKTADNSAQRLIDLSETSVANVHKYERDKREGMRKSSAFRSEVGSSSIDFRSFVPSPSEAARTAVTAGVGASLGHMAEDIRANRTYISALEKLDEASKSRHVNFKKHAGLNISVANAEHGLKNAKAAYTDLVKTRIEEGVSRRGLEERRLEKQIRSLEIGKQELQERRFRASLDMKPSQDALYTASQKAKAAKPMGRRWKGGVKGALIAVAVEKVIEKVAEAFDKSE